MDYSYLVSFEKINRFVKAPKWVIAGLAGVIMMYVGLAGTVSVVTPWWLGVGDAPRHIDYSWSLYNGDLPRYTKGLQYPVFNELRGEKYGAQNAAKNPPLFYVIHTPVIGPVLDTGHWQAAIALGRALNIFMGVLCILALAWAGWLFGGKRKELFAVAVPAVAVTSVDFILLNQNYAIDVLLVLICTLTFINWQKLLYHGLQRKYLYSLGALSVLGMATKASYLVFLMLNLLVIMITVIIYGRESFVKKFVKGTFISSLVVLSVLFFIGWFYYINYRLRGEVFKNTDAGPADRPYKSFMTVIGHPRLRGMFYQEIAPTHFISATVTALGAVGILLSFIRTRFRHLMQDRKLLYLVLLLALSVAGVAATQIAWAIGYGNFYFRYFLPVIFVFGLVLAYGLLEIKRFRGQLLALILAVIAYVTLNKVAALSNVNSVITEAKSTSGFINKIFVEASYNGISDIVTGFLLLIVPIGLGVVAVSLFVLSKPKESTAQKRKTRQQRAIGHS